MLTRGCKIFHDSRFAACIEKIETEMVNVCWYRRRATKSKKKKKKEKENKQPCRRQKTRVRKRATPRIQNRARSLLYGEKEAAESAQAPLAVSLEVVIFSEGKHG